MATEVGNAKIFAVEKSDQAIAFTKKNFQTYGGANSTLSHGDLAEAFTELDGTVSVVVSNPPYIPSAAVPRDIEVKLHDPELALYGGEDGMQVMYQVSITSQRLLHAGGSLVVEHSDSQAAQVSQLLLADGWRQVRSHKDLTGRDRAVTAIK
jgi:release factor glutamine methyltransferase